MYVADTVSVDSESAEPNFGPLAWAKTSAMLKGLNLGLLLTGAWSSMTILLVEAVEPP
jgi:hypothetical protein